MVSGTATATAQVLEGADQPAGTEAAQQQQLQQAETLGDGSQQQQQQQHAEPFDQAPSGSAVGGTACSSTMVLPAPEDEIDYPHLLNKVLLNNI